MITDKFENYRRYSSLHRDWDKAFAVISEWLSKPIPEGANVETFVDGIKLVMQTYVTLEPEDKKYEGHRKCIDVQFLVKGHETIYYADGNSMEVVTPYSDERDHMQFADNEHNSPIHLAERCFAVFFPMEAHKTQCKWNNTTGAVKIIAKLPL
jgi:YhcH/YjgK/YiaL family protein